MTGGHEHDSDRQMINEEAAHTVFPLSSSRLFCHSGAVTWREAMLDWTKARLALANGAGEHRFAPLALLSVVDGKCAQRAVQGGQLVRQPS